MLFVQSPVNTSLKAAPRLVSGWEEIATFTRGEYQRGRPRRGWCGWRTIEIASEDSCPVSFKCHKHSFRVLYFVNYIHPAPGDTKLTTHTLLHQFKFRNETARYLPILAYWPPLLPRCTSKAASTQPSKQERSETRHPVNACNAPITESISDKN